MEVMENFKKMKEENKEVKPILKETKKKVCNMKAKRFKGYMKFKSCIFFRW